HPGGDRPTSRLRAHLLRRELQRRPGARFRLGDPQGMAVAHLAWTRHQEPACVHPPHDARDRTGAVGWLGLCVWELWYYCDTARVSGTRRGCSPAGWTSTPPRPVRRKPEEAVSC